MESIVCLEMIHWGKPEEWPGSAQGSPVSPWELPREVNAARGQCLGCQGVAHAPGTQPAEC